MTEEVIDGLVASGVLQAQDIRGRKPSGVGGGSFQAFASRGKRLNRLGLGSFGSGRGGFRLIGFVEFVGHSPSCSPAKPC
jgi:hypothetical protein